MKKNKNKKGLKIAMLVTACVTFALCLIMIITPVNYVFAYEGTTEILGIETHYTYNFNINGTVDLESKTGSLETNETKFYVTKDGYVFITTFDGQSRENLQNYVDNLSANQIKEQGYKSNNFTFANDSLIALEATNTGAIITICVAGFVAVASSLCFVLMSVKKRKKSK